MTISYLANSERYSTIPYRRSGRSGLKLPAVSLGLWHNFGGVDRFETGREVVRTAFDHGITHFDLANNYGPPPGSAEETFGALLRTDLRPYRDELIISSKAGYLMWPGPYGDWGSRKYLNASDWTTSISFIITDPIPGRRWKRRWPHWRTSSAAGGRCTWVYPTIRLIWCVGQWRCCANSEHLA